MVKKILAPAVAFAVASVGFSAPAFADTRSAGASAGAVVAPVVTMPEAPVVTAPVAPTLSADTMSGQTAGSGTAAAKASSSKAAGTSVSGKASSSASGTSASALSLLGLGSDNALLKALSGTGSDDAGLDALSSLLGGTSPAKTGASTDQATLDKILALLERQQVERGSAASSASGSATSASQSAAPSAEKPRIESGGELVRFAINGYDILSSVKTEVSSVLARDGSFLITCDRSYNVSGRQLTETFYFLCRKAGKSAYRLFADVSQAVPNPNSFPYRLSRKTPLTGTLTGDLLVFRSSDAELNLDLVIRVINPTDR